MRELWTAPWTLGLGGLARAEEGLRDHEREDEARLPVLEGETAWRLAKARALVVGWDSGVDWAARWVPVAVIVLAGCCVGWGVYVGGWWTWVWGGADAIVWTHLLHLRGYCRRVRRHELARGAIELAARDAEPEEGRAFVAASQALWAGRARQARWLWGVSWVPGVNVVVIGWCERLRRQALEGHVAFEDELDRDERNADAGGPEGEEAGVS